MATRTRQRLIDAAKRRFYHDGFRNVGIDAILTDVGISKAAFYKHFESKDDLMVAVLDDVDQFLQKQFRQMVRERGGPSARGQLRAVLDVVQQIMETADFHGCIFVNAAIEFPLPHDPAHEAARRHKRGLEDFFYELAERAAAADPASLAQELGMVIEGVYVTRAVTRESTAIATARRLVEQIIVHYLPPENAPPRRRRAAQHPGS
jgi:AcrR family transcriptional regulator